MSFVSAETVFVHGCFSMPCLSEDLLKWWSLYFVGWLLQWSVAIGQTAVLYESYCFHAWPCITQPLDLNCITLNYELVQAIGSDQPPPPFSRGSNTKQESGECNPEKNWKHICDLAHSGCMKCLYYAKVCYFAVCMGFFNKLIIW